MNEIILNHRSIRKYKTTQIEETLLHAIINAGIRASNTGNMQVYSIIITKDEHIRHKLWESHFKQNMVLQAPVHLTFCVDINRFHKWCEENQTTLAYDNFLWFINGTIDAVLASQNISLAAESHGLGVCYLGTATYNAEKIIDILELPKGVIPVAAIVLGYPDENPPLTDRLPFEAIVHNEKYIDYSVEKIRDFHKEKENSDLAKRLVIENGVKNFASVFAEKRYKKDDNIHFSKQYFDTLKKQGFFNHD